MTAVRSLGTALPRRQPADIGLSKSDRPMKLADGRIMECAQEVRAGD